MRLGSDLRPLAGLRSQRSVRLLGKTKNSGQSRTLVQLALEQVAAIVCLALSEFSSSLTLPSSHLRLAIMAQNSASKDPLSGMAHSEAHYFNSYVFWSQTAWWRAWERAWAIRMNRNLQMSSAVTTTTAYTKRCWYVRQNCPTVAPRRTRY